MQRQCPTAYVSFLAAAPTWWSTAHTSWPAFARRSTSFARVATRWRSVAGGEIVINPHRQILAKSARVIGVGGHELSAYSNCIRIIEASRHIVPWQEAITHHFVLDDAEWIVAMVCGSSSMSVRLSTGRFEVSRRSDVVRRHRRSHLACRLAGNNAKASPAEVHNIQPGAPGPQTARVRQLNTSIIRHNIAIPTA